MVHSTNEKEEDNSLSGKFVAFFDIEKDPLIQNFKKKQEEKEQEELKEEKAKKGDWYFTR